MTYIAKDQYGEVYNLFTKYPRKELLEKFNRQHADKIYVDEYSMYKGSIRIHVGYIIAGHWLTVYRCQLAGFDFKMGRN